MDSTVTGLGRVLMVLGLIGMGTTVAAPLWRPELLWTLLAAFLLAPGVAGGALEDDSLQQRDFEVDGPDRETQLGALRRHLAVVLPAPPAGEVAPPPRYVIRRVRLAHGKRGPTACERCCELDREACCLLDLPALLLLPPNRCIQPVRQVRGFVAALTVGGAPGERPRLDEAERLPGLAPRARAVNQSIEHLLHRTLVAQVAIRTDPATAGRSSARSAGDRPDSRIRLLGCARCASLEDVRARTDPRG